MVICLRETTKPESKDALLVEKANPDAVASSSEAVRTVAAAFPAATPAASVHPAPRYAVVVSIFVRFVRKFQRTFLYSGGIVGCVTERKSGDLAWYKVCLMNSGDSEYVEKRAGFQAFRAGRSLRLIEEDFQGFS